MAEHAELAGQHHRGHAHQGAEAHAEGRALGSGELAAGLEVAAPGDEGLPDLELGGDQRIEAEQPCRDHREHADGDCECSKFGHRSPLETHDGPISCGRLEGTVCLRFVQVEPMKTPPPGDGGGAYDGETDFGRAGSCRSGRPVVEAR